MIESWNYVRFGDLFDYENKSKIKAGDGISSGSFPFFTSSVEQSKFIDQFQFNRTSLIFGTGGNASIHFCDSPFSVSTDCLVAFTKDETQVYPKFVYFYLSGNMNLLEDGFKGAGLKHISKGFINEIKIPLPPLETQKRIVNILDAADALRQKDQELLKKYDELSKAHYYDILIKSNSLSLKISDIVEVGKNKIRSGPFGSDLLHNEFVDSGITVLGIDNIVNNRFEFSKLRFITNEKFRQLSRYQVFKDDVLITIMGTVGRSAVVPDNINLAINTKHIVAMTLDTQKANPFFISYTLTHNDELIRQIKKKSKGAIMDGLNIGIIKDLEIELPSIEEQNSFANFLKKIESLKNILLNYSSENLIAALIQKAFNGELVN